MPQAICFISNAPFLLDESELHLLFDYVIKTNSEKNITGFLIYKEGTFLQLLEGSEYEISRLFDSISLDPRHNHVTKMLDRPIERRIFQKFEAGSTSAFRHQEMAKLNSIIETDENSAYARICKAFLKPFVMIHA